MCFTYPMRAVFQRKKLPSSVVCAAKNLMNRYMRLGSCVHTEREASMASLATMATTTTTAVPMMMMLSAAAEAAATATIPRMLSVLCWMCVGALSSNHLAVFSLGDRWICSCLSVDCNIISFTRMQQSAPADVRIVRISHSVLSAFQQIAF